MIQKANQVITKHSRIKWHDWSRYSNRQKSRMSFGGLIGDIIYEGNLSEFLPFIELCQIFHIGKQTSFGLGKINFKIVEIK